MFFINTRKKQQERMKFFQLVHDAYNELDLSEPCKKKLAEAALAIEKKQNLKLVAVHLYPYVKEEYYHNPELKELKEYVEKKQAYYWIGYILPTAFVGFQK